MRTILLGLGLALILGSANAVTIHSSPFITSPTHMNSFEALGPVVQSDEVTSHSEDGISVEYVGGIVGGGIVSQLDWAPAPDGQFVWYPGQWGLGYTRITFDDATAIQFYAKTSSSAHQQFNFELFLDGTSVAAGVTDYVQSSQNADWSVVGFSDAVFDEVHLAMPGSGVPDTGALDAIAISAVPELPAWAMLLAGAGLFGSFRKVRAAPPRRP